MRLIRLAGTRRAGLKAGGFVALAGLVGLGSYYMSGRITARASAAPAAIVPFTLRTELYNFDDNPEGDSRGVSTEAQRSDGTKVSMGPIFGLPGLRAGEAVRVITFPDMRKVALWDSVQMKATWRRLSPDREAQAKAVTFRPPADCVFPGETLLGYGSLMSEKVAIVKGHMRRPTTMWRALELGCVTLSYRISEQQPGGSLRLLAEDRPVGLTLGKPDPRLFDEGVQYTEAKPSEAMKRVAHRLGIPWDDELEADGKRTDDVYAGTLRGPTQSSGVPKAPTQGATQQK